jgi:hypothetical protein
MRGGTGRPVGLDSRTGQWPWALRDAMFAAAAQAHGQACGSPRGTPSRPLPTCSTTCAEPRRPSRPPWRRPVSRAPPTTPCERGPAVPTFRGPPNMVGLGGGFSGATRGTTRRSPPPLAPQDCPRAAPAVCGARVAAAAAPRCRFCAAPVILSLLTLFATHSFTVNICVALLFVQPKGPPKVLFKPPGRRSGIQSRYQVSTTAAF